MLVLGQVWAELIGVSWAGANGIFWNQKNLQIWIYFTVEVADR